MFRLVIVLCLGVSTAAHAQFALGSEGGGQFIVSDRLSTHHPYGWWTAFRLSYRVLPFFAVSLRSGFGSFAAKAAGSEAFIITSSAGVRLQWPYDDGRRVLPFVEVVGALILTGTSARGSGEVLVGALFALIRGNLLFGPFVRAIVGMPIQTTLGGTTVAGVALAPGVSLEWQFDRRKPKNDRDRDKVFDDVDACPDEKGTKRLNGCPDDDGDGIANRDDACPSVAGLSLHQGCPIELAPRNESLTPL